MSCSIFTQSRVLPEVLDLPAFTYLYAMQEICTYFRKASAASRRSQCYTTLGLGTLKLQNALNDDGDFNCKNLKLLFLGLLNLSISKLVHFG